MLHSALMVFQVLLQSFRAGKRSPRTSWPISSALAPVIRCFKSISGAATPMPLPSVRTPPSNLFPRIPSGASKGTSEGGPGGNGREWTSGQSLWGHGFASELTPAKLLALASLAVSGLPRFHRSRIVAIREQWWYSSEMTVHSGIQAEIARVGTRNPRRLKVKPN